ncbi:hypothetical protein OHA40_29440 [Nocardia sp. NBC_00508]|uniref:hypothetical protein n=1 Tax=Nocardia sp. NBC_00508 TaxID=2975992 RepID=UPI002E80D9A6|nr:hypothetical protein [Nocardia sp. NBC_00508]WUD65695.1 hypothetical protein OHA40_29440 [Nocardia sp. NBC_00508]
MIDSMDVRYSGRQLGTAVSEMITRPTPHSPVLCEVSASLSMTTVSMRSKRCVRIPDQHPTTGQDPAEHGGVGPTGRGRRIGARSGGLVV